MYLNDILVSWDWKMQALVSLLTMESEFVSAARGVQEAMGCYRLVKESEISIQLPIQLRMDNQAAITCIMNEAILTSSTHLLRSCS
jgi:hypothetical protein